MTFGLEDINNNQSKINNNNQNDVSSNINDFSTINNNTNHSIVINDYINSYSNSNNNNDNKNNIKLKEKEGKKINDYLDDEHENQNDDIQILSEDEENKKEEIDNKNNNTIKKNDMKLSQITEGKEIMGVLIPNKINKGLKLLEEIQIKRESKKYFINSAKLLSKSDNNNIITNKNFNDDELINNEKINYIFKNELFNDDGFYYRKNNTFKPKKTQKIIENMTKNKKCEVLNEILTELFDKKEKNIDLNLFDFNIKSRASLSNRSMNNEDKDEEKYINKENNHRSLNKENIKKSCDPLKMEKYIEIFNLNPIKNLELILNKKKSNEKFNFTNINNEYKYKPSILTYNKKLKKKDNDDILIENEYLSNSNKNIDIKNYKQFSKEEKNVNLIKDYNNKIKISFYDTPKFNWKQRKNRLLKKNKVWTT